GLDGVSRAVNEAERGLLPAEATVVVGQPLTLDPSRAPDGAGLLWIQLQELPWQIKGDAAGGLDTKDGTWTEELRERYADRIQARIKAHLPNLESAIRTRVVLSPADERQRLDLADHDGLGILRRRSRDLPRGRSRRNRNLGVQARRGLARTVPAERPWGGDRGAGGAVDPALAADGGAGGPRGSRRGDLRRDPAARTVRAALRPLPDRARGRPCRDPRRTPSDRGRRAALRRPRPPRSRRERVRADPRSAPLARALRPRDLLRRGAARIALAGRDRRSRVARHREAPAGRITGTV